MSEHPSNLHMAIEAAKALRLHLAAMVRGDGAELSADDLQTIQDTFEGETTLDAEIRNALLASEEDEILVTGIKARVSELAERKSRFEKRIEARRGLIAQAMAVAQLPKLQLDVATLSCAAAKPRVEVDQESEIPTQFFKRQDPVLDKAGLTKTVLERHKAIVAAGADPEALKRIDQDMPEIPGCHVVEGGMTLRILRR